MIVSSQQNPVAPLQANVESSASGVLPWDFVLVKWSGMGFEIRIGVIWLLLFIVLGVLWGLWFRVIRTKVLRGYRTQSITLRFRGLEWTVCPDHETRRIAYEAWVEINSRKVGLPFDESHDVIVEVYNSWYQLFGVLRNLAKSVPVDKIADCEDSRKVVELLMSALNEGLRPHLTQWQAKFRRWYDSESAKPESSGLAPQDIQLRFPEYTALAADLKSVNREFVQLAKDLFAVVESR